MVRDGVCPSGRLVVQIPRYYVATSSPSKLTDRLRSKTVDETPELVKTIVRDICYALERPEDELWLYGSGHGAFVVRAVAGIMHHMGLPRNRNQFEDMFQAACALIKAQLEDDYRNGPQLMQTLKSQCNGPPRMPFVGLFDTVKLSSLKTPYDISFNPSIESLRHALAINENRQSRAPEVVEVPQDADMSARSLIQAWFLGTTDDMCGGTENDGLSLYPLQWMLLESIQAGLSVGHEKAAASENALSLVFPQYAGGLPNLDGSEDIEWRLRYTNGIQLSMFDLQSTHAVRLGAGVEPHTMKFASERYSRNATRKVFGLNGLHGWNANGNIPTHESVIC